MTNKDLGPHCSLIALRLNQGPGPCLLRQPQSLGVLHIQYCSGNTRWWLDRKTETHEAAKLRGPSPFQPETPGSSRHNKAADSGQSSPFTSSLRMHSPRTTQWGTEWRRFVPILWLRNLRLRDIQRVWQDQWFPCWGQELCAVFHSPVQILLYYSASRSAGSFTHSVIHSLVHVTNACKHIFHTQHGRGTGETMGSQAKSHCHWMCGPEGEIARNT